jgi:hypothetical protein
LKNTITSFKFSFVLLLLLLSGKVEGQLSANFSTLPLFSSGSNNITICQGSSVIFVLGAQYVTNISPTTTVTWSFTGANINLAPKTLYRFITQETFPHYEADVLTPIATLQGIGYSI